MAYFIRDCFNPSSSAIRSASAIALAKCPQRTAYISIYCPSMLVSISCLGSPCTVDVRTSRNFFVCSSIVFSQTVRVEYSLSSESPVSHSGVVSSASARPLIIIVLVGSTPPASYLWIVDLFTPIRLPSSGIVRFNSVRRSFTRSPTCFAVNVISFFKVFTS